MANVIYRGPVAKEPQTINLPVAGAYLPGTFVTSDGDELTQATDADAKVYLLGNRRFMEQGLDDAYEEDDTAVAYEVLPGERYQARMAAATYTKGDALTVGAAGRLAAAATAGDNIVAYFDGSTGAVTAGALADVIIANGYTVPAAT